MQKSFPINEAQVGLATEAAQRRNQAQNELLLIYRALLAQHGVTAGHVVDITPTCIVIEVPDEVPAAPTVPAKPQLVAEVPDEVPVETAAATPAEVSKPQLVV